MRRKAIIVGLSGIKISKDEKKLLKKFKPWGVILFERNLKNFNQIKNLINNIKKIMNDKKYPILIDEEGGKVARLKKLINIEKYSQEYFGKKLGGYLLSEAIKKSFEKNSKRVWVHTCSLDHKHALSNYISRGMKIFQTDTIHI